MEGFVLSHVYEDEYNKIFALPKEISIPQRKASLDVNNSRRLSISSI